MKTIFKIILIIILFLFLFIFIGKNNDSKTVFMENERNGNHYKLIFSKEPLTIRTIKLKLTPFINNGYITKIYVKYDENLKDYFKDMNLSENQMQLVCKYLSEHNIKVAGYEQDKNEASKESDEKFSFTNKDEAESEYLNMYLDEVKNVKDNTMTIELFEKMKAGDDGAKEIIVNAYLPKVISVASSYQSHGLSQSDLIQEGNIGLLMAMAQLEELNSIEQIEEIIDSSIREAMLAAIDEFEITNNNNNHIIKKADMVKEKAEELSEAMNDKMTMEDMADYMDMDLSEIQDILRITGEEL